MLNLKFKLPLLALSISTALIASQIVSAAPYRILPLGDSITNGIYNGGNALAYRDDLHLKLKAGNYSYEFVGKCPTDSAQDETGDCDQPSLYSKGVINEPATSGAVFLHEGRAGWHANQLLDRLGSDKPNNLLDWYGRVDAVLLHIGTNDIYVQANDVNKNNNVVEAITYTTTFNEIKAIVAKIHSGLGSDVKIYLAKILPMGMVQKTAANGSTSDISVTTDAAKGLNDLIQAYSTAPNNWGTNVIIVNQNFGEFNNTTYLNDDFVHPNRLGEEVMATRWFNQFKLNFEANGASETTSTLISDKSTMAANDTDIATITLQAKDADGDNLVTGGDTVTIINSALVFTPVIDNGDGTYTTTAKRPSGAAGAVTVRAKINTKQLTDTATITFLAGQKISFTPPATVPFSNEELSLTATSQKFSSVTPTGLKVTLTSADTSVCTVDENNKLKLLKLGDCKLTASQAGDATYGAAADVEKTIKIEKGDQTITFDANTPSTGFIGEVFTVKAVSTSGLNVAFTATPSNVCSIDGNAKVTLKATGTCKVTASQAGNAQYKVAPLSFANITVSNDKVTLPTIADKTFGVKPFAVTAKSSAGAVVTLTATPAKVCKVSGNTVTVVGAGECTLTAKTAHAEATTSFTIKKKETSAGGGGGGVDKGNSDSNKSGGSISPLWLLMLGFVGLLRRKVK